MGRIVRVVVLGLLLGGGTGRPLAAQEQEQWRDRKGFWVGLGAGYGSSALSCDECIGRRDNSIAAYFALGGTLSPHVLLGGESDIWYKKRNGFSETRGTVTLTGYFYPSLRNGLFIKTGLGLGVLEFSASGATEDHYGGGALFGLGYDVPVSHKVALVPNISYNVGFFGSVDGLSSVNHGTLQVGMGITLH